MPLISSAMNNWEENKEWQTRSARGLPSPCLIFPTGACVWWFFIMSTLSFNSNQDWNCIVLYTIQTYTKILHLLSDPVKHGKSSSSPAAICTAPSGGHVHAFIFFSASHLPASCCPNPVSPTLFSPLPLSAAYILPMLYDYCSPPCTCLPGLTPNILFSLSFLPT